MKETKCQEKNCIKTASLSLSLNFKLVSLILYIYPKECTQKITKKSLFNPKSYFCSSDIQSFLLSSSHLFPLSAIATFIGEAQ